MPPFRVCGHHRGQGQVRHAPWPTVRQVVPSRSGQDRANAGFSFDDLVFSVPAGAKGGLICRRAIASSIRSART